MKTALVCDAGVFIGGHMVKYFKSEIYLVKDVNLYLISYGKE